jgi:hypothetical protein
MAMGNATSQQMQITGTALASISNGMGSGLNNARAEIEADRTDRIYFAQFPVLAEFKLSITASATEVHTFDSDRHWNHGWGASASLKLGNFGLASVGTDNMDVSNKMATSPKIPIYTPYIEVKHHFGLSAMANSTARGNGSVTSTGASTYQVMTMPLVETQTSPFPIPQVFVPDISTAAFYVLWRETLGSQIDLRADRDGDHTVGPGDYSAWRAYFGASPTVPASALAVAPEPSAQALLLFGVVLCVLVRRL